jgi:hypothetical protein
LLQESAYSVYDTSISDIMAQQQQLQNFANNQFAALSPEDKAEYTDWKANTKKFDEAHMIPYKVKMPSGLSKAQLERGILYKSLITDREPYLAFDKNISQTDPYGDRYVRQIIQIAYANKNPYPVWLVPSFSNSAWTDQSQLCGMASQIKKQEDFIVFELAKMVESFEGLPIVDIIAQGVLSMVTDAINAVQILVTHLFEGESLGNLCQNGNKTATSTPVSILNINSAPILVLPGDTEYFTSTYVALALPRPIDPSASGSVKQWTRSDLKMVDVGILTLDVVPDEKKACFADLSRAISESKKTGKPLADLRKQSDYILGSACDAVADSVFTIGKEQVTRDAHNHIILGDVDQKLHIEKPEILVDDKVYTDMHLAAKSLKDMQNKEKESLTTNESNHSLDPHIFDNIYNTSKSISNLGSPDDNQPNIVYEGLGNMSVGSAKPYMPSDSTKKSSSNTLDTIAKIVGGAGVLWGAINIIRLEQAWYIYKNKILNQYYHFNQPYAPTNTGFGTVTINMNAVEHWKAQRTKSIGSRNTGMSELLEGYNYLLENKVMNLEPYIKKGKMTYKSSLKSAAYQEYYKDLVGKIKYHTYQGKGNPLYDKTMQRHVNDLSVGRVRYDYNLSVHKKSINTIDPKFTQQFYLKPSDPKLMAGPGEHLIKTEKLLPPKLGDPKLMPGSGENLIITEKLLPHNPNQYYYPNNEIKPIASNKKDIPLTASQRKQAKQKAFQNFKYGSKLAKALLGPAIMVVMGAVMFGIMLWQQHTDSAGGNPVSEVGGSTVQSKASVLAHYNQGMYELMSLPAPSVEKAVGLDDAAMQASLNTNEDYQQAEAELEYADLDHVVNMEKFVESPAHVADLFVKERTILRSDIDIRKQLLQSLNINPELFDDIPKLISVVNMHTNNTGLEYYDYGKNNVKTMAVWKEDLDNYIKRIFNSADFNNKLNTLNTNGAYIAFCGTVKDYLKAHTIKTFYKPSVIDGLNPDATAARILFDDALPIHERLLDYDLNVFEEVCKGSNASILVPWKLDPKNFNAAYFDKFSMADLPPFKEQSGIFPEKEEGYMKRASKDIIQYYARTIFGIELKLLFLYAISHSKLSHFNEFMVDNVLDNNMNGMKDIAQSEILKLQEEAKDSKAGIQYLSDFPKQIETEKDLLATQTKAFNALDISKWENYTKTDHQQIDIVNYSVDWLKNYIKRKDYQTSVYRVTGGYKENLQKTQTEKQRDGTFMKYRNNIFDPIHAQIKQDIVDTEYAFAMNQKVSLYIIKDQLDHDNKQLLDSKSVSEKAVLKASIPINQEVNKELEKWLAEYEQTSGKKLPSITKEIAKDYTDKYSMTENERDLRVASLKYTDSLINNFDYLESILKTVEARREILFAQKRLATKFSFEYHKDMLKLTLDNFWKLHENNLKNEDMYNALLEQYNTDVSMLDPKNNNSILDAQTRNSTIPNHVMSAFIEYMKKFHDLNAITQEIAYKENFIKNNTVASLQKKIDLETTNIEKIRETISKLNHSEALLQKDLDKDIKSVNAELKHLAQPIMQNFLKMLYHNQFLANSSIQANEKQMFRMSDGGKKDDERDMGATRRIIRGAEKAPERAVKKFVEIAKDHFEDDIKRLGKKWRFF